jgi:hypothetical protein
MKDRGSHGSRARESGFETGEEGHGRSFAADVHLPPCIECRRGRPTTVVWRDRTGRTRRCEGALWAWTERGLVARGSALTVDHSFYRMGSRCWRRPIGLHFVE